MNKRRGIALMTVLMVASVLLVMMGSFVSINQHHFSMLKNDQSHAAAAQAAYSAFDYCTYRLEKNKYWGGAPFNGAKDTSMAGFVDVTEVKDSHKVQGRVLESEAEFEIEITNNIEGKSALDGVPDKSCRIRITGTHGTSRVSCETILSTAPLFDGAVIASQDINIDSQSLTLSSSDPFRNRLRAKDQIDIKSDYRNSTFKFEARADATEKGVLWAKEGISVAGRDLSDPDNLQDAMAGTAGGQFFPKAETAYDVYDLQIEEVKSSKNTVHADSGIYVFNRRQVAYTNLTDQQVPVEVPVLERRDWAVDTDGNMTHGDVQEAWYLTSSLPDDAASDWVGLWGDVPEAGLHPMKSNEFSLDSGVHVHFRSLDPDSGDALPPEIVLNSDVNIQVNGDFGVTSFSPEFHPTITFRDPETGAVGDASGGTSGSITALHADGKPGSIFLEGWLRGNGKLLAEGNVTVKNTYADVSSDEESDLSIYAGGTVKLLPTKAKALDDAVIFGGQDVDGTTVFRGLIFAGEDVIIDGDKNDEDDINDFVDITIEGAVVARNGSVNLNSGRNVHFKYNPNYLDTILEANSELTKVRLERVVWKES